MLHVACQLIHGIAFSPRNVSIIQTLFPRQFVDTAKELTSVVVLDHLRTFILVISTQRIELKNCTADPYKPPTLPPRRYCLDSLALPKL
jgi:hypothetical protein